MIPMNKRYILYVDDDVEDFNLVQDVFSPYAPEIELIHRYNGVEAIEYLRSVSGADGPFPHLVVLDINMPLMNGKETLVQIRQNIKFPDVPIVMLSTLPSPLDYNLAEKWGAQIMTKPAFYNELKDLADALAKQCGVGLRK